MKKIFLIVTAIMFLFASGVSAQSGLSSLLGKVLGGDKTEGANGSSTTENVVSNVLSSVIGSSMPISEDLLLGTWNYTSIACVLSSNEALANIGGALGSSKIEETLNGYLGKVGVKEGSCSFTFQDSENCLFKVAGREISGTYTLNADEKKIEFKFYKHVKMTADVAYNLSTLNIVFNADKLLSLVKSVTSKVAGKSGEEGSSISSMLGGSSSSATLGSVSSLLENYDGMMLGMKLKK